MFSHMTGELAAIRVTSRKPPAAIVSWSLFGINMLNQIDREYAIICGGWLMAAVA